MLDCLSRDKGSIPLARAKLLILGFYLSPYGGEIYDPLAQLVEHTAFNRRVLSPSLRRITNIGRYSSGQRERAGLRAL